MAAQLTVTCAQHSYPIWALPVDATKLVALQNRPPLPVTRNKPLFPNTTHYATSLAPKFRSTKRYIWLNLRRAGYDRDGYRRVTDDVVTDTTQHGPLQEAHAPCPHHDHRRVYCLRLRHDAVSGPTQLEARVRLYLSTETITIK